MKKNSSTQHTNYNIRHTSLGFTLIEMLVVISIIGLLAVLIAANLNSARGRARDAQRKSDLRNMETALRLYYNDKGGYPVATNGYLIKACGSYTAPSACDWNGSWAVGNISYMTKMPIDPLSPGQNYKYEGVGGDTFTLTACLENASDPNAVTVPANLCSSGFGFQLTP